ncbi:MAG: hypothetical protein IPN10_15470 [Saprospiraceae bacterium]|nr:hypothetical protein [Saprospiraceae bacterium]
MNNETPSLAAMLKQQEHLNKIQHEICENFNLLLESLKTKVDNQDIVVENQSRIISNQDIIVNNQLNIIKNQKQIVQNQVTLAVILKTQVKVLASLEQLKENPTSDADIQKEVSALFLQSKEEFEKGLLDLQNI